MLQNQKRPPEYLCWSSKLIILPSLVHRRIAIHSGRSFSVFQIKPSMLFNRSGSLVRTKKLGSSIHILKKKKKK
jgi:ribosomal protein S19